jgi:hypothetical protein
MNPSPMTSRLAPVSSRQVGHGLACLTLFVWLCAESMGQIQRGAENPAPGAAIHVIHVLGFEGARRNATGDLRIQGGAVQFQRDGVLTAEVKTRSIQEIFVEDQDKQVGGTVMTLGKAAAPYGGGRVLSLFTHKKYDLLTVEYIDSNGGFHGAIFRLVKGQGQSFKRDLVASGAHLSSPDDRATTQSTPEVKHDNQ